MWELMIILVLGFSVNRDSHVDAVCHQCKNGFACISENEFQLCFENRADTTRNFTCPDQNEICSQYSRICMPKNEVKPACRGLQNCVCDDFADYQFVCTSRTTFTMCLNQKYTTVRGKCPNNQICDVTRGRNGEIPCVNKCLDEVSDASICDFDTAVDVEQSPATTVTPTTVTPSIASTPTTVSTQTPSSDENVLCRSYGAAGRYPYPEDKECRNYIQCYWNLSEWVGSQRSCPSSMRFDGSIKKCVLYIPSNCDSQ